MDDPIAAHSFNNAVWLFGTSLEHAINSVEDKDPKREQAKRQQVLNKWIPTAPDAPKPLSAFATPRPTM